jgi:lipopolysaccharide transport system permease protein
LRELFRLATGSNVRNFVYYWDLLNVLVKRDIKLHYRRSALGILWAQINPIITVIIFSFVFQKIVPLGIPNYPAYVFIGLLAWQWFSSTVNSSSYTLVSSRDLIRKPKFSTEMIVAVSVTSNLVNYLLAFPVLIGLLLLNGVVPTWTLVFLPLIIAIQFIFTFGLSLLISASNVYFRDIQHIIGALVTVWFYITPIFYAVAPNAEFTFVIEYNPMAILVNAYRQILLYAQVPNFANLIIMGLVSGIILAAGYFVFGRLKYGFIDQI